MNSPFMAFQTRTRPRVMALDHFCVVVSNLDRSAAFYTNVLGLECCPPPEPMPADKIRWVYTGEDDRPLIHLLSRDQPRAMDRDMTAGPTGALHHIALRCEGFDAIRSRLEDHGVVYETNTIGSIGLRQIFAHDPDGVLLELNFFED